MLNRLRKLGLRTIIFISFGLVLLTGIAVAVVLVWSEVRDTLTTDLSGRGKAALSAIAGQAQEAVKDSRKELARSALSHITSDTLPGELDAAAILLPKAGNETVPDVGEPFAVYDTHDTFHLLAPALTQISTGARWPFEISGHPVLVEAMVSNGDTAQNPGRVLGYVVVILDPEQVQAKVSRLSNRLEMTFGVFGVMVMGLVFGLTQFLILGPLKRMREVAISIGEGDLTQKVAELTQDELGVTAEALNKISESLNTTIGKVKGVSDGISSVMQNLSRTSEMVSRGSATSKDSVAETSSSMEEMIASLKGIANNVEVLAQSAEESSSSIVEMAATNEEVVENIVALAASVEETTSAIEQMTFSIKEVAKNVEDLSASTEETSSSMNEMDVSIGQVEMNANETAKLAELVNSDAASGVGALQKTLAGIEKIKDSSRTASQVIDSLGRKILTIGNILNVIDDVAEQTNLLALNAAIIAAQAGEHGKGFAVVADEIKDLAERTGASTKEIADLIKNVQDESRNAVTAMERGVKNVDEGVRLGSEAEGALRKILESSTKASQMVKAIARATVEQSRGSKQVTDAINRIAETVQQINKATAEQARGSEQIMKSAEKMKVITKHVERSSQEQARGSKQITRSIESISEMVNQLNRAQKEQTKGSENVLSAMENIKHVADGQTQSIRELERAIQQLSEQADVLESEVRRFRV